MKVIAGQVGLIDGAEKHGVAWRTLLRYVQSDLDGLQLRNIQAWPSALRLAMAYKIEQELPKTSLQWVQKCKTQGGGASVKSKKPLPSVENWREATVKRILISV